MTCDRCGQKCLSTICSMFNTQMICDTCKEAERNDPRYADAVAADESAIRRGDFNFKGIGYLDDDENVKAMRETAREIGLTQLLLDIARSPANMGGADIERLLKALVLLGVSDPERTS